MGKGNHKRPVYMIVRYTSEDEGPDAPFILIDIKQTSLAADIEAAKHTAAVKKGFVTY